MALPRSVRIATRLALASGIQELDTGGQLAAQCLANHSTYRANLLLSLIHGRNFLQWSAV